METIDPSIEAPDEHLLMFHSGRRISPFSLGVGEIYVEDIALSLSRHCRFNGQTKFFYSTAQHAIYGSLMADRFYARERALALSVLFFHAVDAYLGQVVEIPPCRQFRDLKTRIQQMIARKFGLVDTIDVHIIEWRMGTTERLQLLSSTEDIIGEYPPFPGIELEPVPAETVREAFLLRYRELRERV